MRKKTIERVPFIGLSKVKDDADVRYTAVTDIKQIDGTAHLFVEVYKNQENSTDIPAVRIVLTEDDFGTYFPEKGIWSRGRITKTTWTNNGLIWQEDERQTRYTAGTMEKENVLQSEKDLAMIKSFLQYAKSSRETAWWNYIDKRQEHITYQERREQSERRDRRRREALREREENTPELPEGEILSYADRMVFHQEHRLYYKKHRSTAEVACSKCGGVTEERWRQGQSYESSFEVMIEEPRRGAYDRCPLCGEKGRYIPLGDYKTGRSRKTEYLFLGQRYKNGMVFRYIEVGKEWELGLIQEEKGPGMYNAREVLSGMEIARAYFEPGKKIQKDYHKHNPYTGMDFWDDCNLSGMSNIYIKEAGIMPETYENMKGTFLEYSALKEYERAAGPVNAVDYMERYIQTPQIEMMVKLGLIKIAGELVRYHCGIVNDTEADRADTFLGIRKERVRQLIRHKGDIKILETMQMEKKMDQHWTEEQIERITELDIAHAQIPVEYIGIQQFLNRVSKYAGCEYGTMCSRAVDKMQRTARTYIDYLHMREQLGYDMDNTVYLYPKDLGAAHAKMVSESNKKRAEEQITNANERYRMIGKKYRSLRRRFYFEDDRYLIRPARNAGEIVMEGRILHHCVGSDRYLEGHNKGESIILFLRDKKEPDMPYITVEIDNEQSRIRQWYGAHDGKPDEDRMQKWLDAYVIRLRCRMDPAAAAGGPGAVQDMLAYA